MPNDSPDWQAGTDNGPIHLGELVLPANGVAISAPFALPATTTGICVLVRAGAPANVLLEANGFTSNYDYLQAVTVPPTVTGPYFAPISGAFEGTVNVLYSTSTPLSTTQPTTVATVYALCGAGYSIVQAPPHQPDAITGTVSITPSPLPVDPGGRNVGIAGQPIGVTVNPNPLPITGIPNPLPVDASGHTVPVSGTVTVNENPRISAEQRVQFNVTTTTTLVAGVAGKVLTVIGFRFDKLDAGGVFPSVGTWILWSTSSHKVFAQGSYYAATAAGLMSQETQYRDADGKPPSAPAGEGLAIDVIPAGGTTQQYIGFVDFTQV